MKNKIGSIIASIFLLLVVGALVYMFYIQTIRIKDLRKEVESLETAIAAVEGDKAQMEASMDAMEAEVEGKDEEIGKMKVRIESMEDKTDDIKAIRNILEENFDYSESMEEDQASVETVSFLDMTGDELTIYESFREEYKDEMLTALEPFTVMKLYIFSGYMKDYETQYELYVDYVEGGMNWTKEEHLNIPEENRTSDYGMFEEAYDVEVEVDGDYALVEWKSDYDDAEDFKYGFSLTRNDKGIWKVNFLPMQ